MPTLPPYDVVNTVLNAARTRLNDEVTTLAAIGGKVLRNTQAFSQQVVNDAWRKFQEGLAEYRYSPLKAEIMFTNVNVSASNDPAIFNYFDYNGFFDGSAYHTAFALPQDFIRPYSLWERSTGSSALMTEMDEVMDLPRVPKSALWNREWQWRGSSALGGEKLYVPGIASTGTAFDVSIAYATFFPDFADIASSPGNNQVVGPWFTQPVPIMRCLDAFADYICREYCIARGDMDGAQAFQASADMNCQKLVDRDTAQGKSIYKTSEYGKMADRFTPAVGPNTQTVNRRNGQ